MSNDEWTNELMDIEDEFEAEVLEELRQRYEHRVQDKLQKAEKASGELDKLKKKDQSTCD